MRRRTVIPLIIVLAVLAALGLATYLRSNAPPEAARLLPESDAIVYLKLSSIRSSTHFDQAAVQRSPSFQHFIDATGIVPERDLDSVAFALHHMPDPLGPNGPVAYSEVFIGHFDGARLAAYLQSIATSRQTYAGHVIYTVPVGGPPSRPLRIAQLGYDTVAASNMPTPEQIHSMLDRFRASALSTSGSSLLTARYRDVPLLSEAWGIGRIGLPFAQNGFISFLGLQLPLPSDTDLVASLRYTPAAQVLSGGAVHLRIEEIAPTPRAATRTADTLTAVLDIIRGIGNEQQPHDDAALAMRSILNSVTLSHHEDHAILSATASIDQLRALTTAHPPSASPNTDPDAEPAAEPAAATEPSPTSTPRNTLPRPKI